MSGDAKVIVADSMNQINDLATQTIQMSDAMAQDLVAQAGSEFRCNGNFVKAGVSAQLQYIIDDLKFWKLNQRHMDQKPIHAVCWINPTSIALYPSASDWLIDTSNMPAKYIVKVFGYNFWPDALPSLELFDGNGTKLRDVNVRAAYVTHYQINLDFSNEKFQGVQSGARIQFNWPDQAEQNTINLTLNSPGKLKLSDPVFTPSVPVAQIDAVTLQVMIKNEGGSRSDNVVLTWKPDINDNYISTINQLPLEPGQSRLVSFPGFRYQRGGSIMSEIYLSNGDDALQVPLTVQLPPPQSVIYDVTLFTGCVDSGGTDARVFITLIGSKGSTDEVELFTANYDQRQSCAQDSYQVISDDLGDLVQLEIRHDNCCNGPGWFLEKVVVSNRATNQSLEFLCHKWLAVNMEDGHISRTIYPGGPCK
jgi:hypothetical protein